MELSCIPCLELSGCEKGCEQCWKRPATSCPYIIHFAHSMFAVGSTRTMETVPDSVNTTIVRDADLRKLVFRYSNYLFWSSGEGPI
jgi:hypothetical protein